jgi:hypothetical protein
MNSNQLTDFHKFDAKRILFTKPEVGNIPGSKLTFKRIRIAIRNPDGTTGDLILATPPNLMCFGLQETTDQANGKVNGYQFPMVLWNRNDPSSDEKLFTEVIHQISDACKEHLVKHREDIDRYDLEMNDLKKFNPLYYKMEKGRIVEGKGPMFYIKTLTSKKDDQIKINTVFTDEETSEVLDPFDLLGKRCYVQGAIKIESIFIGTKISLQTKLYEATVKIVDTSFRSLLNPNVVLRREETKPKVEEEVHDEPEEEGVSSPSPPPTIPTPLLVQPTAGFTETGSLVDEDSSDEEDDDSDEEDSKPTPPVSVPTPKEEEKKPTTTTRRAVASKKK